LLCQLHACATKLSSSVPLHKANSSVIQWHIPRITHLFSLCEVQNPEIHSRAIIYVPKFM
jgi:hypothetical protein